MPTLSDLSELSLDSSPLKPASEPGSPSRQNSPGPRSDSPTPMTPRATQHKPPAEDMTQFAAGVARVHKLNKVNHDQLQTFAQYNQSEQLIYLAGSVFSLAHHQRLLKPADAPVELPKKLRSKILEHSSILLLDASIPAYRDEKIGPVKLLMDPIDAHGVSWSFTDEMKGDRDQMKALKEEIGGVLTPKRNGIKNLILGSLGNDPAPGETLRPDALNVVDLADAITSQQKDTSLKVDAALCGRIALLRKVLTEDPTNKYWTTVDTQLAQLRVKYPDTIKLSKFIKRYILDIDCETYGSATIPGLAATSKARAPAAVQANAVASGSRSAATVAT
ncbi:hypothetical protein K438DRAFT_1944102 [Mycena galopus ATCC 62051]|nr:hypothetical protein K438DRAFT_1944102 [Mycena galopus ATCC 62051]